MGLGIAQVFASHGKRVIIRVTSNESLQKSQARLNTTLTEMVSKSKISEATKSEIIYNTEFTTELSSADGCDLVVEAIIEDMEIKKSLFNQLDKFCGPETIFTSNTSAISITELASSTCRTDKFVGLHFFNPALTMKLIEVVRGADTTDETFYTVYNLSKEIGKMPIEVSESPGFVVNRILVPMMNEAAFLVAEGVASVADIDRAMRLGANHPMGPLTLADFVGIDLVLEIMETIYNETGDQKYRPAPLLRKMVRAGKIGKKAGEGFYKY